MVLRLKLLAVFCLSLFIVNQVTGQPFALPAPKKVSFETKKIKLNRKIIITVEMAENDAQHEYGLMLRTSLPKDHGMLFIFKDEKIRNFWMKNTLINLSIGYFDKDRKLVDIQEMAAVTTVMQKDLPTYPSRLPAMYALEMAQGWFSKNKINLGSTFDFVRSF